MNFKTKSNDRHATPSIPRFFFAKTTRKYTYLNHSLQLGRSIWEYLSHHLGHIWKEVVFAYLTSFFFLVADSRLIPLAAFSHHYLSGVCWNFLSSKTLVLLCKFSRGKFLFLRSPLSFFAFVFSGCFCECELSVCSGTALLICLAVEYPPLKLYPNTHTL